MSAILYQNSSGRDVTTHSYSGGSEFRNCARKYQLRRLVGWKEKKNSAAREFGKCVESAIQAYHENECKPGWGVDEFKRFWAQHQEAPLDYTDREGNWKDLYQIGTDFLKLYELKWETFGYTAPRFQASYRKVVFPGSELSDLDYVAYIDLLGKTETGHIIVDIKTGAAALDETPGMLSLDPQLRRYAWVSGIPNVAFLQFIKTRPGLKKGDDVIILSGAKAGEQAVVLMDNHDDRVVVLSPDAFEAYQTAAKGLRGKALEGAVHSASLTGMVYHPDELTKQRLQFLTTVITPEEMEETGEIVGREMVEIVAANKTGKWAQNPGVRFPDNRCGWCALRGICLKNQTLVDDLLVQPEGSEWLEELEKE